MKQEDLNGYEGLANAIILQACRDYRVARKKLKKNPKNAEAAGVIRENKRFFRSPWFGVLTKVDGEYLLNRLKEECE